MNTLQQIQSVRREIEEKCDVNETVAIGSNLTFQKLVDALVDAEVELLTARRFTRQVIAKGRTQSALDGERVKGRRDEGQSR